MHWGLRGPSSVVTRTRSRSATGSPRPSGAVTFVATDYYYACLDGNWDANGNGVFGEANVFIEHPPPDAVDTTPEIHVGRVSARSVAEIGDFLAKYFRYVYTPPTDGYLDRYLLLGEVLFHAQWSLSGLGDRSRLQRDRMPSEHLSRSGARDEVTLDGATDCLKISALLGDTLGLPLQHGMLLERAEY